MQIKGPKLLNDFTPFTVGYILGVATMASPAIAVVFAIFGIFYLFVKYQRSL